MAMVMAAAIEGIVVIAAGELIVEGMMDMAAEDIGHVIAAALLIGL